MKLLHKSLKPYQPYFYNFIKNRFEENEGYWQQMKIGHETTTEANDTQETLQYCETSAVYLPVWCR